MNEKEGPTGDEIVPDTSENDNPEDDSLEDEGDSVPDWEHHSAQHLEFEEVPSEEHGAEREISENAERVSKLMARAGIASRRAAEEIIIQGRVSVNGHFVREPGAKADPARDRIVVDNKPLVFTEKTTTVILLHKPKYVMTTKDDQGKRTTVMELLPHKYQKFHPVGRLDYETTGVLLLSDDGELTNLLTHPSHGVEKVYEARVRGEVTPDDLDRLQKGVYLDDIKTAPCRARVVAQREKNALVELTLREGRNRQVRRMLESVGHPVSSLRRTKFGSVELEGLEVGAFRVLLPGEVKMLRKHAENGMKDSKKRMKAAAKATVSKGAPKKEGGERPKSAAPKGARSKPYGAKDGSKPARASNTSPSSRAATGKPATGKPAAGKPSTGKPQNETNVPPKRTRAPRDEQSPLAKRIERKWR